MAQECYTLQLELTLIKFGMKLLKSEHLKHNLQMHCMLFFILEINQNINNEHQHKLVQIG